jgi:glyoxylase-like metal-dependent hydrolase (beta-lactamase superfamily II)
MKAFARIVFFLPAVALAAIVAPCGALAQGDFDKVDIGTTAVADGIYMLTGAGGNLGLSAGPDGLVLIDDQYAPLTDKIRAAVAAVDPGEIRFVLNTHWHGDHTGGNESLGKTGSVIVAHDNVRARMSVEQVMEVFGRTVPASPAGALPIVTFNDTVTFHLNGQTTHVFHVEHAHTDGDAVVHFREANVIHAGDIVFAGQFPFIDVGSGGSIDGVIAACDRILEIADAKTRIIPGHGELTDRAGLVKYRDMLTGVRDAVSAEIAAGKDLDAIREADPLAPWAEAWGTGFMKPDVFLGIVVADLSGKGHAHGD